MMGGSRTPRTDAQWTTQTRTPERRLLGRLALFREKRGEQRAPFTSAFDDNATMQDMRELDQRDLLFLEQELDEHERLVPLDAMEELLRDGSPEALPPLYDDDLDELLDFSTWSPVPVPRLVAPALPSPTVLNVLRGPLDDLDELLRDLAQNEYFMAPQFVD
jgi:hypothetical protein